MVDLKFIRLPNGKGHQLPSFATTGSAGMDICAAENVVLHPNEWKVVPTGWSVIIPDGFELQVRPRSGLAANKGITVLNAPGTIDSDYRGEIGVVLINLSPWKRSVMCGDRIAQLVMAPVTRPFILETTEEAPPTERGEGGFGSTGR